MNKNFPEWYKNAVIEPTSEQINNRWSGIELFKKDKIQKEDIFELVRMFYNRPATRQEFIDRYVGCFIEFDSAFDSKKEFELSILAGTTLVEIIENSDYSMLAIFASLSFSFIGVSLVVPAILEIIKENFIRKSYSLREEILYDDEDDVKYESPKSNEIVEVLKANQTSWTGAIPAVLIDYIIETNEYLKDMDRKEKSNRKRTNIYAEDSQILWWMTSGWCNDLDKSFHDIKQAEASPFIGKELADKIKILPGPYSAKAVIHKMLECCNKKNKVATITLKDVIENLDTIWKKKCLEKYDTGGIQEITPIMFAISKSLTVDEGADWNPQFKKITKCNSVDIKKSVEEISFQMYLECLTIKCYNYIEE